jgi:hypothetical protein
LQKYMSRTSHFLASFFVKILKIFKMLEFMEISCFFSLFFETKIWNFFLCWISLLLKNYKNYVKNNIKIMQKLMQKISFFKMNHLSKLYILSRSWGMTGFNNLVNVYLSRRANLQNALVVTVAAHCSFNNKERSQK